MERLLLILTWLFGWLKELTDAVLKLLPVVGTGGGYLVANLSQTCTLGRAGHGGVTTTCRGQLVMLVLAMLYRGQHSIARQLFLFCLKCCLSWLLTPCGRPGTVCSAIMVFFFL